MRIQMLVANAVGGSRTGTISENQFAVESMLNCKGILDDCDSGTRMDEY